MSQWIEKWIEISEDEYETPTELVVKPHGKGWSAQLIGDPDAPTGTFVCYDFKTGDDFLDVVDITIEEVIGRLNDKCKLDLESMMFI